MSKFHQFNIVNATGDIQDSALIKMTEIVSAEPHFDKSGAFMYTTINLSNRTAFNVEEDLADLEEMLSSI